jgi:hypothetical protein
MSVLFLVFFNVGNRCSAGKTIDGQKFQDTHPDWQSGLISPWYNFLRLRHRKLIFIYYVLKSNRSGSYRRPT